MSHASFFRDRTTYQTTPAHTFLIIPPQEQELSQLLELDYELGVLLKDRLVPHAVMWYTGEAVSTQFDPEFEGGDDDDDEDDEGEDESDEVRCTTWAVCRVLCGCCVGCVRCVRVCLYALCMRSLLLCVHFMDRS